MLAPILNISTSPSPLTVSELLEDIGNDFNFLIYNAKNFNPKNKYISTQSFENAEKKVEKLLNFCTDLYEKYANYEDVTYTKIISEPKLKNYWPELLNKIQELIDVLDFTLTNPNKYKRTIIWTNLFNLNRTYKNKIIVRLEKLTKIDNQIQK